MHAAECGLLKFCEALIHKKCSLEETDKYGRNALIMASLNNHNEVIELILGQEVQAYWKDNVI
jgi:ankyrin repeat protein